MIYPRHLTAREMIEDFGVPAHIAHFIIAIEKGETQGCIVVVDSQEDGTALDSELCQGRLNLIGD
jgi:hypothetical protein